MISVGQYLVGFIETDLHELDRRHPFPPPRPPLRRVAIAALIVTRQIAHGFEAAHCTTNSAQPRVIDFSKEFRSHLFYGERVATCLRPPQNLSLHDAGTA